MKKPFPSISIFFPCFNDRKTIGKLVKDAYEILMKYTDTPEVIVIDDGSTDGARAFLKKLKKTIYPDLKLIFHPKNLGYGAALSHGFSNATGELIAYTDGDGQYDIRELPRLLALMDGEVSFVNGIKEERHDPIERIILGNLYKFVARWMFWLPIINVDCDFRLVKRAVTEKIQLKTTSGTVCVCLVKKAELAGAIFAEVTVSHYPRAHGQSQFFTLPRLTHTLTEYLWLWVNLMLIGKNL
ncbi:glycosyltransferase family 2 protein [Candidatus Gottesmanbacteria bacterium]|nr:glycosyltransferase family 2 protein [Candidatus Gottesmanbacteria bacterium]